MVDCGLGNIHSLLGCLARIAPHDQIDFTARPRQIATADGIFLPGDGSFSACVAGIDARGLRKTLIKAAQTKPFFGICVGMQVLFEASEEGPGQGLGVLPGTVEKFPPANGAKIPLMGWLDVKASRPTNLTEGLNAQEWFYFLNSYCVKASHELTVLDASHTCKFAAAVAHGTLFATQFHPEKSSSPGVGLLERFVTQISYKP